MEARIAKVEEDTKLILRELAAFRLEAASSGATFRSEVASANATLRVELGEVRGKVSQLPTTIQLLGYSIAVLVAGGLVKHFFP